MTTTPPNTPFRFNGRFNSSSVTGAGPTYTVTGTFNADGSFNSATGFAWTSIDLSTGAQTNTFLVDSTGKRYQVTSIAVNTNPMEFTINDIDSIGSGPFSIGAGTLYVATSNSNISLAGAVTSLGLSEALQQNIRGRAFQEIDGLLQNSGISTATLQTTDDTPTAIFTFSTTTDRTYQVEANFVARRSDSPATNEESLVGRLLAGWRNNQSQASATQIAQDDTQKQADIAAWEFGSQAGAGTDVEVFVTGAAASTIEWTVFYNVRESS